MRKIIIALLCLLSASYATGSHHPMDFLNKIEHEKNRGEKIYTQYCALCHNKDAQIPLHAPRRGVAADWAHRELNNKQLLLQRMDAGIGAMPARGGCFECSDQELQEAIDYLLMPHQPSHHK